MTQQTIPVTHFVPRSVLRTLFAKVTDRIETSNARRQEERTLQAVVAELQQLPDYLLSDIGILRSDLPSRAPRILDFHPHLIASRIASKVMSGSSVLPQNMSSR